MCKKINCGCNTPGNEMICYRQSSQEPCIGVNLTVNNTEKEDGSDNTRMILDETNNISAFEDHLEFVNSPESLSGLKRNVVLRLTNKFLSVISNIFRGRNIGTGASIYKGPVVEFGETYQEFKRLRSTESVEFTDGPNYIIATVDPNWVKRLFTSGEIDICKLIKNCEGPNTNPIMVGDIAYNLPNRTANFPIQTSDFQSRYFDAEGDTFTSIKITGGNLTGLTKTIGGVTTPLAVGDIIPVANISDIKFSAANQNSAYTQTITYVAIASNGHESN